MTWIRRAVRGPAPWLLTMLVLVHVVVNRVTARLRDARASNMLVHDAPVASSRWDRSVGEHLEDYWSFIPDGREHPLVIVSGMSQMYAINQPRPDDEIVVEHLDDALQPAGVRAFGLAAPNMNNEEALLLLVSAIDDPRTHPAGFVYGLCFDKFRNVELRPALRRFLGERTGVQRRLSAACDRYQNRWPLACARVRETLASLSERHGQAAASQDDTVETSIRDGVSHVFSVVREREFLNAYMQEETFNLRNAVLRINARTKRPIIESRYALNREILELMIQLAHDEHIATFMYVIPLNRDGDPPYVMEQYAAFREWAAAALPQQQVHFADLDGIIPPSLWGVSPSGEVDFKHFTGEGHRLTAQALLSVFGNDLRGLGREH